MEKNLSRQIKLKDFTAIQPALQMIFKIIFNRQMKRMKHTITKDKSEEPLSKTTKT